jgi:hypothetical protein
MNLTKKITPHSLLVALLVFGVLFLPVFVYAETDNLVVKFVKNLIFTMLVMLGGFVTWAGGLLLNYTITNFVVGFGDIYLNNGLGYSIDKLWGIVRDIFNLTFIFGLVFIGFKIIFGDNSARRTLGTLIIAALLVNFSLFITKIIIDFANIAAAQFANGFLNASKTAYDVSDEFMKLLGTSDILSFHTLPPNASWIYIIMTFILLVVSGFVFFAGGVLLAIRFVVLNIYMILSPVMFLGWVFPGFSSASKKFWDGFLQKAFFAPAYILMLYLSFEVLSNMKLAVGSTAKLSSVIASVDSKEATSSFNDTFPFFLITIVFLVASLVVAQKMGAQGATSAIAVGKRWSGKAKNMATGVAVGTVGATTYLPRAGARWTTNKLGTKLEQNLNKFQTKTGARAWLAKTNVADRLERGIATKMQNAQFGTGTTNKAEADYKKKTVSRASQTAAENIRAADFKKNTTALTDSTKSAADLKTAIEELGKTVRGMSKDEKNNMSLSDLTNKSVAVHLTDDDIKNMESSGGFSAADVQQVKDARKSGYVSIAAGGNTLADVDSAGAVTYKHSNASTIDTRSALVSRGAKETGKLAVDIFKQPNMYNHITPAMLEERIKNGISDSDRLEIRDKLYAHLVVPTGGRPSSVLLADDMWVKWEKGNSTYAAEFFR